MRATNKLPTGARLFDLEQPRTQSMPILPAQKPGFNYFLHRHHEDEYEQTGPRTTASGMIVSPDHCGTHIDALCHQADELFLCGGVPVGQAQTSVGFTSHGADEIPPIVSPAVFLDVASSKGVGDLEERYQITAEDIEECCEYQDVSVEAGDIVLVRTGGGRHWSTDAERYLNSAGVSAEASQWMAERRVFAVGADNVAWDLMGAEDPELGVTLPGHLILLARGGIYIIENLLLEELSAARAYRFMLVCAVPGFAGATGSPVRPLALVDD
ncbi:MAG: cyclase family protein [Rubrobacter sp.]|nr:cyclase family protein [Rubrobacter sp.]